MGKAKIVYRKITDLLPYENNARTHSEDQVAQIAASITEFGWTNPILIDGENGIIAGHGRSLAATMLGMGDAPCIVIDGLSDTQKRALIIADNKLAENAGWDEDILAIELSALDEMDFDLSLIGFDADELADLMADQNEGLTDEDAVPETPQIPTTVQGDVWLLGKHRLMCGDSTSIDDVEKLMDGQLADMWLTDPPPLPPMRGKQRIR